MGVPTSEVGYTSATIRTGDHEVYMDIRRYWGKKTFVLNANTFFIRNRTHLELHPAALTESTVILYTNLDRFSFSKKLNSQ
jgi:hypothetical protein